MKEWFRRHKEKLWWLHSLYALLLGIAFIWLGARSYAYLRIAVFHVGFIWLSSLFLPKALAHPRLPPRWAGGIRLLINYFNKNLYQQVLFFVLPIYYASATLRSRNFVFVVLVGLSTALSTVDVVYDRHLSVKQSWTAVFFAFNLFALINVILPVLWSVNHAWATRLSALLALAGFLTLYSPLSSRRGGLAFGVLVGVLLAVLVERGRSFIPPAPLRLVAAEFGAGFQAESRRVEPPLSRLEPGGPRRIYGLTAVRAPLGLKERVRHLWYEDGSLVWASPFYEMLGGREEGFRLWTAHTVERVSPGSEVTLDLETEGGQLIGRAVLGAGR